jgi:hypothetical protein
VLKIKQRIKPTLNDGVCSASLDLSGGSLQDTAPFRAGVFPRPAGLPGSWTMGRRRLLIVEVVEGFLSLHPINQPRIP